MRMLFLVILVNHEFDNVVSKSVPNRLCPHMRPANKFETELVLYLKLHHLYFSNTFSNTPELPDGQL